MRNLRVVSDELTALIARLEREVAPLERALRLREAEEAQLLRVEEGHLAHAIARRDKAEATLKAEATQLAALEARRVELRRIIDGWRGQLWSIGYGALTTAAFLAVVTALPVLRQWFPTWSVGGVAGAQLVAFLLCYLLIPRKK